MLATQLQVRYKAGGTDTSSRANHARALQGRHKHGHSRASFLTLKCRILSLRSVISTGFAGP